MEMKKPDENIPLNILSAVVCFGGRAPHLVLNIKQ